MSKGKYARYVFLHLTKSMGVFHLQKIPGNLRSKFPSGEKRVPFNSGPFAAQ